MAAKVTQTKLFDRIGEERRGVIRLACLNCDTEECDGIEQLKIAKQLGWRHVFQDPDLDADRDDGEWWTHLGSCPDCPDE